MTLTATGTVRRHRPFTVVLVTTLLAILGLGAVGGGWAMIFGIGGADFMSAGYLEALPLVNNWVVPGLILLVGFGIGSLVVGYGIAFRPRWPWLAGLERLTKHHWSWTATIVIGAGQVLWILLEVISIPFSILMPIFGFIGLALALLPLTPTVSRYLDTE
jgi:hypothetical protein